LGPLARDSPCIIHYTVVNTQRHGFFQKEEKFKNTSCNAGFSAVYGIIQRNDELQFFMASSEFVKDIFKGQTLNEPKLLQLDRGFYKWFTAMHPKGKL